MKVNMKSICHKCCLLDDFDEIREEAFFGATNATGRLSTPPERHPRFFENKLGIRAFVCSGKSD